MRPDWRDAAARAADARNSTRCRCCGDEGRARSRTICQACADAGCKLSTGCNLPLEVTR